MAKGNEDDLFMLDVAVPPYENEFEEEQLREDCNEALSKLPTTEVGSFRWNSLKKKVVDYKEYLQAKSKYLEKVEKDRDLSMELYAKSVGLMEQLAAIEQEATEKRQSTRPSKRRRC
ncbi:unnamed protein product [Rodentolepis nana]|uniref:XRCC4 n=1 Tax=Rodentolepis nana TaxID=102285 RepID=A0A0R3TN89_RODNA|nr:unnamed protein product [Rodentolepis nana]